MEILFDLFTDFTVRNVALGALLLGITSGVLGTFAVLRQQSLLGDALSHAALPGVCLGFLVAGSRQLVPILAGALLTGAMAALLVVLLTRRSRLSTDAALGIALSFFFAIGTVLLTYIQHTRGAGQAGLDAFLFGQAAAMLPSDLWVIGGVTAFVLLVVALLWKEMKVTTFDAGFATSLGLPVGLLEVVMTVMIAFAVVIGLQMVGVILMAAMVIAPAVAARQWARSLGQMVALAAVVGAAAGVLGALVSASNRGLSTGPLIVVIATAFVLLSLLFAPRRGLLRMALLQANYRASLQTHRVLQGLEQLALSHDDPDYASEEGMIDALFGTRTRQVLRRLQRRGLVDSGKHMPEEGPHWALTPAGRHHLRELSAQVGGER